MKSVYIENGIVSNLANGNVDEKGWVVVDADVAVNIGDTAKQVKGKWHFSTPPQPSLTYAEKRQAEYKPINEQLDMLYWDRVNNTNHWQNHIKAVKAKYPKPKVDST